MREAISILLLVVVAFGFSNRQFRPLFVLVYTSIVYTLITVVRSDYYGFATQIQLFINASIFLLLILAVPIAIRDISQARRLLSFVLVWGALLSLSSPLQEVTGPFTWLYSADDWVQLHGRGGFVRHLSLVGDPNVGGMLGALLPLILLIFQKDSTRKGVTSFVQEVLVWAVSFLSVAYSLSFTALVLLLFSIVATLWFSEGQRSTRIFRMGIVVLLGLFLVPKAYDMASAILLRAGQPFLDVSPTAASDMGFVEGNIGFRLFSYLDINNTAGSILFGSTYNAVSPSSAMNDQAILAHNGYKETFIAGGIVGLVLLLTILGWTLQKAYRLFRHRRHLPVALASVSLVSVLIFVFLAFIMIGFPLQRYNGIGMLFWVAAGLIHVLHDNLARSELGVLQRASRR